MSSKKILLVKKLPEETRVSSVVVGETGFYWRSFANAQEVASALQKEDFGLLFFDHRGVAGDPLTFIDSVRDPQKITPVFLISDPLEMVSVIQAIRLGVKDYFQPPLDLRVIIERVQAVLKTDAQHPNGIQLEKWSEFVMFLADGSIANAGAPAKGEAKKNMPGGEAAPLALVRAERDSLAAELKTLRAETMKAQEQCARLEKELGRGDTSRGDKNQKVHDAAENQSGLRQLQQELAGEREKFETERLLLKQAQKKLESIRAAGGSAGGASEADLARREQALAAERKVLEEKSREMIAAQEKLEAELMILVQSKAKLEKEQSLKIEQAKAAMAESSAQQKKLAADRTAFEQAKMEWGKTTAAWPVEKAKTEAEFGRREKALAQLEADTRKLADAQKKLAGDLEQLETEQNLLAQAATKLEKTRAENEIKFTQRENALVDRALALDVQEKARSAAEDQFLIEQEKLDSATVLLAQGRQALDQAKLQWEETQTAAQVGKAQAEAEFVRREQGLVRMEAEAQKLATSQKKIAAELEKLEAERSLFTQEQGKFEKARSESEAKQTQRENELAQRTQTLTAKEKAQTDVQKQLAAEREKLNAALLLATQTQTRVTQESKTLDHAKAQWEKTMAMAQAEKANTEAAYQKRVKDLAEREEQIGRKEKALAPLKVQLQAEQEKLETEQLMVKQSVSKVAAERVELTAARADQQRLKTELAGQEAAMQEIEVKTQTQLARLKKAQAQLSAEQAALTADRKTLDQDKSSFAERVRQFETRQQQFKDQMKQMLSGS